MALLEDERLHAGPREICRAHEPVVATTDDDRVVALAHVPPPGDPAGRARSPIDSAYGSSSLPGRLGRQARVVLVPPQVAGVDARLPRFAECTHGRRWRSRRL